MADEAATAGEKIEWSCMGICGGGGGVIDFNAALDLSTFFESGGVKDKLFLPLDEDPLKEEFLVF